MSDESGPAFPATYEDGSGGKYVTGYTQGMTLRDYFAAKGMQAFICTLPHMTGFKVEGGGDLTEDTVASQAYHFADAMLKARGE